MKRPGHVYLCLILVAPMLVIPTEAQDREKVKWLVPTRMGSTGLFNLPLADTLRRGEVAVGFHGIHFNRAPGNLDFTIFSVTVTGAIHDRIELSFSWEPQRRVHADGFQINKIAAGDPLIPARLLHPKESLAFFNETPFLDVGFGSGQGELRGDIKINLFSEPRNDPLGLAFRPVWKLPLSDRRTRLLKGLTNGAFEAGYDLIVSKNLPFGATATGLSGVRFTGQSQGLELQHRFTYGAGLELPLGSRQLRFVTETLGSVFLGPDSELGQSRSPVDLYLGLRIFPSSSIAISTAYGVHFRTDYPPSSRSGAPAAGGAGWLVQLSFQRRINRPPTIECQPLRSWIKRGEVAPIRVSINDPDDSELSLTWKTARGTILSEGRTAFFDSTGLGEGTYRVSAEVSDGQASARCSARIDIQPKGGVNSEARP